MKTINLTDDQFDTLFEFVNQKVEAIVDASVHYNDSEILNELEGVISFAHFNGYYDRLRKECNWDGYPETRSKDLKDYQDLYGLINLAGDDFDYRWC